MPVETSESLNIECDNSHCPGNDLDPAVRTGWLFVSSEVYGEPTQQHVFCSNKCLSAAAGQAHSPFEPQSERPTTLPA